MPTPSQRAVFLSYAREDTDAVRHLADALRNKGVTVWFDQNELAGGDLWDQKIRGQIKSCGLFVPVISAHTQARVEGYFRREWKMAVERTHDMADHIAFLLPVVIDETTDQEAHVPEKFREVQWTRLPDGATLDAFVARVQKLLAEPGAYSTPSPFGPSGKAPAGPPGLAVWVALGCGVVAFALAAYVVLRPAAKDAASGPVPAAAEAPPAAPQPAAARADSPASEKSIAVLPFENLSAETDSPFLADGMHNEVITALAKIHDLTVISRRSVMAYRKTDGRNLRKIATELGVASVLEGSVQRAGSRVRVIVQLVDAASDAHLWAEDYTEDANDVFRIQSKIASAITSALKATLSLEEKTLIGRRMTQNRDAYEFYLQARLAFSQLAYNSPLPQWEETARLLRLAVAADPRYAGAYALLAEVHAGAYWAGNLDPTPARRELALQALRAAQLLAPDAPETRLAEGRIAYACELNFPEAKRCYESALADLPNDSDLISSLGSAERRLGRLTDAVEHFRRAIALDPSTLGTVQATVDTLSQLGRFPEAIALGERYTGSSGAYLEIAYDVAKARYEMGGDRDQLVAWFKTTLAALGSPSTGWIAYQAAFALRDYAGAAQALADPKIKTVPGLGGTVAEPASLYRAFMAALLNQPDVAAREAAAATQYLRAGQWTPRQQPLVKLALVRAAAYGGQKTEALRLAAELSGELRGKDYIDEGNLLGGLGHVYAFLDTRDEAFDCLRKITAHSARLRFARDDPFWSRLKDDPRFEDILAAARRR